MLTFFQKLIMFEQYRIASHIPVVMANHRRAQSVENKDDRQRAGEKAEHNQESRQALP